MPSKKNNINLEAENLIDLMTKLDENKDKMGDLLYNSLCKSLKNIANEKEKHEIDTNLWKVKIFEKIVKLDSNNPNVMNVITKTTKEIIVKKKQESDSYCNHPNYYYNIAVHEGGLYFENNTRPKLAEGQMVLDYNERNVECIRCKHCKEMIYYDEESEDEYDPNFDKFIKNNEFYVKYYRMMSAEPINKNEQDSAPEPRIVQ